MIALSSLTALATGLFTFRFLSKEMRILVFYIALAIIGEIVTAVLAKKGINNLWSIHIFTFVEYFFYAMVFSYWQKNLMFTKILRRSTLGFFFLGIVLMLSVEDLSSFNNYTKPIECILLIAISAYTLLEISKEYATLLEDPRFWICIAVLLYVSSTLILFALSNTLIGFPRQILQGVWSIYIVMNMVVYFLFAKGFLCQYQIQKSGGH